MTADRLLGAWRLVTWQETAPDGRVSYPMGANVTGQLMYDRTGRMSAQLAATGRARFASENFREATREEMARAWPAYFGYFGTFSVDAAEGTVTHHVESGWFPNLAGTAQVRRYRFEHGRLVLDADTPWGLVRIVWERV